MTWRDMPVSEVRRLLTNLEAQIRVLEMQAKGMRDYLNVAGFDAARKNNERQKVEGAGRAA